jgi:Predicted dithiol-disulfide isomerase involved in polyketide biosynthesis
MISVDVISDFICPWCYLGHKRLDRLIQQHGLSDHIQLRLSPYQLYPETPEAGSPIEKFAKKSKPGVGRALRKEAQHEQIVIDYKKIKMVPSTIHAHRLSLLAIADPNYVQLSHLIFDYYFSGQGDINNIQELAVVARRALISEPTIEAFVDGDGMDSLMDILTHNRSLTSAVPAIRISDDLVLPGLQTDEVWTNYLKRILKKSDRDSS